MASAQSFFKSEKKELSKNYSLAEKKEVIASLCGKSARGAERVFVSISPQHNAVYLKDRERAIADDKIQFQFIGDPELRILLERVKNLIACPQDSNPSTAFLIKKLAQFYLSKNDPGLKKSKFVIQPISDRKPLAHTEKQQTEKTLPTSEVKKHTLSRNPQKPALPSRYIATSTKKSLFTRALHQCEFIDSNTNSRCESKYGLQIEHVKPFAAGGDHSLENLKLYCHGHNQLAAIRFYGEKKMGLFLKV